MFKAAGRMFALVPLGEEPCSVSLKCDPGLAIGLRGRYAGVTPGYHLSKRHWNTVALDGSVPDEEVAELIDHSYDLVVAQLTKAQRDLYRRELGGPVPGGELRSGAHAQLAGTLHRRIDRRVHMGESALYRIGPILYRHAQHVMVVVLLVQQRHVPRVLRLALSSSDLISASAGWSISGISTCWA